MAETIFIEEIDALFKAHYGDNFQWKRVFASNFNENGVGWISIDITSDEIQGFSQFLREKIKAKKELGVGG